MQNVIAVGPRFAEIRVREKKSPERTQQPHIELLRVQHGTHLQEFKIGDSASHVACVVLDIVAMALDNEVV